MNINLIRTKNYLFLIDQDNSNIVSGQYFYHSETNSCYKCTGRSEDKYEYIGNVGNLNSFPAENSKYISIIISYFPLTETAKELEMPLLPNPFREDERVFSLSDIKETLRVGVNIGMSNLEKPSHINEFNFNQSNALSQCEEYINDFIYPEQFIPEYSYGRKKYNLVDDKYEWFEFKRPKIIVMMNSNLEDELKGYYLYK